MGQGESDVKRGSGSTIRIETGVNVLPKRVNRRCYMSTCTQSVLRIHRVGVGTGGRRSGGGRRLHLGRTRPLFRAQKGLIVIRFHVVDHLVSS